ncbi:ATP-binding protein [Rhizobium mayense]|uniref:histidine kinase n=1 Tax=Rhizobium mayense TaxID=1312184 RepID=A0ABT7JTC4_9HYPH|nr:ATP-binding protein [Rhizobium mayense]MDL2398973.1 ATP-binding protein [Rhizobium mayense]
MAVKDFDRIFDGFFSSKADGMGIGLAICRSIITDHGGTISAENDGTMEAAFIVTLPAPNGGEMPANGQVTP